MVLDTCVSQLSRLNEKLSKKKQREADYNTHLFLDAVFAIDKDCSKQYHALQIQLYIEFDRDALMNFLFKTDSYQSLKAIELCKKANLHKEQALVYFKMGLKSEAI